MTHLKFAALILLPLLTACGEAPQNESVSETIKIGGLFSRTALPKFIEPALNASQMALEETNAAGGVKGQPLELIVRDDRGNTSDGLQATQEFLLRHDVKAIFGATFDNVASAVSQVARREQVPFFSMAGADSRLTWQRGHDYIFVMEQASGVTAKVLAQRAAETSATRWAFISSDFDYGRSITRDFQSTLKELKPDAEFVAEFWPPVGKLDAGPTVQALAASQPDGIFISLFDSDLAKYLRQARLRGLMDGDIVYIHPNIGWPEQASFLKDVDLGGWHAAGHPGRAIGTSEYIAFADAYKARYGSEPVYSAALAYSMMKMIAAAMNAAEDLSGSAIVAAAEGLPVQTPLGETFFRPQDHRISKGEWIGIMRQKDGKPQLSDFQQIDVQALSPSAAEIQEMREN